MEKRSNWDGSKLQCDFVVNELGSKLSICPVYTNQNSRRWRNGKCLYLVTSGNQAKWFTTSWNKTPSLGLTAYSHSQFPLESQFCPEWCFSPYSPGSLQSGLQEGQNGVFGNTWGWMFQPHPDICPWWSYPSIYGRKSLLYDHQLKQHRSTGFPGNCCAC